ncbi:hypothetical protein [Plastoroseomonas arctica]|uniref:Lipoprotein n=1 Tax=Plastoroseomonas arctica TaxID=1509237 RepID=A0AAF1K1D8_9PROT|nr:hypothetical protein [Plastoroseomonas arctica]MBR0657263.1 hypothetical protein [Plastoroseomonas arctica]
MRRLAPALLFAVAGCAQHYDDRPVQIAGPIEYAFARRGGRVAARMPTQSCAMPALDDPMLASRLIDASLLDVSFGLPEVVVFDCARRR